MTCCVELVTRSLSLCLFVSVSRTLTHSLSQVTRLEEEVARARKGAREASDLADEKRAECAALVGLPTFYAWQL